jgi:hypothetical protein
LTPDAVEVHGPDDGQKADEVRPDQIQQNHRAERDSPVEE